MNAWSRACLQVLTVLLLVGSTELYAQTTQKLVVETHVGTYLGEWTAVDISGLSNVMMIGNPALVSGPGNAHNVFVRNSANEIIHVRWTDETGLRSQNLNTVVQNAITIVDDPFAVVGPNNTLHVFGRGATDHLIHYFWSSSAGWSAEDLTTRTGGSAITGNPSVRTYPGYPNSPTRIDVYAHNAAGQVIRYHWDNATSWSAVNLITAIGSPHRITAGITATSPYHIVGRNDLGDLIFYRDKGAQGWEAENLTASYASGSNARLEAGFIANQLTPIPGCGGGIQVFGRNSAGEVIQYSLNSPLPGWTVQNLTATSGTGLTIAGDLAFNRLWFPHLFATDASGNLIEYACSGGTWSASNITAGISSPFTMMGPLTVGAIGGASRHVYGHDTRNHLIRYNWSGGAWSAEDLTALTGDTVISRAPTISGPGNSHHVYGRDAAGDLNHFTIRYPWIAWTSESVRREATATTLGGIPIPVVGPNNTLHVFGRGATDHLIHYFWSSSAGWSAEDLTTRTGGSAITGNPSVRTYPGYPNSPTRIDVYAHNAAGQVIRYHWDNATSWSAVNLTTAIGSPHRITAGITATSPYHIVGRNDLGDLIFY